MEQSNSRLASEKARGILSCKPATVPAFNEEITVLVLRGLIEGMRHTILPHLPTKPLDKILAFMGSEKPRAGRISKVSTEGFHLLTRATLIPPIVATVFHKANYGAQFFLLLTNKAELLIAEWHDIDATHDELRFRELTNADLQEVEGHLRAMQDSLILAIRKLIFDRMVELKKYAAATETALHPLDIAAIRMGYTSAAMQHGK